MIGPLHVGYYAPDLLDYQLTAGSHGKAQYHVKHRSMGLRLAGGFHWGNGVNNGLCSIFSDLHSARFDRFCGSLSLQMPLVQKLLTGRELLKIDPDSRVECESGHGVHLLDVGCG